MMTREEALPLLPCYVSGDLPPAVAQAVEETLEAHEDLDRLVDTIRDQNERAVRALCDQALPLELLDAWADEVPPEVPIERPHAPPRSPGWAPLAAAATALVVAALLMAALAWSLGPNTGPVASVPSVVYAHEIATGDQLQAFDPDDAETLEKAFVAAGVPRPARAVPDLSHVGLKTEQVYILPGQPPATAVEYSDGDTRYLCQMWVGLGMPDRAHLRREVGDTELRGYQADGVSLVMWTEGGMLCVMSAAIPLDDLMALTERRLVPTG